LSSPFSQQNTHRRRHREGNDIDVITFFVTKKPQKISKRKNREGALLQAPAFAIWMKLSTFLSSSCLAFSLS
jgi:hypothetical protein